MNITEMIQNSRPSLKESTIKQYERQLKTLQNIFDTDSWEFLEDIDKVKNALSDKHFTTQRNFYNSIIVLLLALNKDKKYTELIDRYTEIRDQLNQQYLEQQQSGKITDKQSDNFISKNELLNMLSIMEKEIKKNKLKSKNDLNADDIELLTRFTIFTFLINLPVRNDLAGMKYINKTMYNKTTTEDKTNYLVKDKSKMFAVLNDYKTKGTFGSKIIDIPKSVEKVLKMFIKSTKKDFGDVLFVNRRNEPISRNGLSQFLLKTSQKYLDKNISTTMIRKIVFSDEYSEKNKSQKKLANIAGHSVELQNLVYVKEKE
jgi:hypothetical protein